jgi:hypothetical protein
MRAGKGTRPIYVGKAAKRTFRQECFTPDKRLKLTNAMTDYERGTPVVFLIVHTGKGKLNLKVIDEVEQFLIQNALARNPDQLQNVHFTKKSGWWIGGVFRSQAGQPSHDAVKFRKALGLG